VPFWIVAAAAPPVWHPVFYGFGYMLDTGYTRVARWQYLLLRFNFATDWL
jgi:hypothetical protein